MYRHFKPRFRSDILEYTFNSGAKVSFKAIGALKDLASFDGTQFSLCIFDEAQNNFEDAVVYLLSRLRSKYNGKHQLIMTANPRHDSWLKKWVEYCLDDDGVPKAGTENIVRWFIRINNTMIWGDTKEELTNQYPDSEPRSFRFIPANCDDNKPLLIKNPQYVANLKALKRVDYLRLYLGSWTAKEEASGYWKQEWAEFINPSDVPRLVAQARGWDMADTPISEANPDPDWSCGVKVGRDIVGNYYVLDAYRVRARSGEVIQDIAKIAKHDGIGQCTVVIQKDSGSAGAAFFRYLAQVLAEDGVPVKSDQQSGWTGKLQKFLPFASLCENSGVKIVKGDWNDWFISELEAFDGGFSRKRGLHDDAVDSVGTAFRYLAKNNILPTFLPPDMSSSNAVSIVNNS